MAGVLFEGKQGLVLVPPKSELRLQKQSYSNTWCFGQLAINLQITPCFRPVSFREFHCHENAVLGQPNTQKGGWDFWVMKSAPGTGFSPLEHLYVCIMLPVQPSLSAAFLGAPFSIRVFCKGAPSDKVWDISSSASHL